MLFRSLLFNEKNEPCCIVDLDTVMEGIVLSDFGDFMRRADPAVDALVRDDLIEAAQILIDETFLGAQAETDTTPIGIFNSVVAVPSSGATAANYDADLQALEDKFLEANLSLDGSYYVMSETRAARMGRLRDALGNNYYSGMQGTNKELSGRPVVTSETVGEKIGLIKTSELLLAQDGGVDVLINPILS